MIIIALLGFVTFGISLIWSFIVFDKIIKYLYLNNREIWDSIGKPNGFFWNPGGGSCSRGDWSRMKISLFLPFLFKKPGWTQIDQRSQELFNKLRTIGTIGILAWLVGFIGLILTNRSS